MFSSPELQKWKIKLLSPLLFAVHDKSSAAGDPLTDPGEYENLPFHGLQSAPNKVNIWGNPELIEFERK